MSDPFDFDTETARILKELKALDKKADFATSDLQAEKVRVQREVLDSQFRVVMGSRLADLVAVWVARVRT